MLCSDIPAHPAQPCACDKALAFTCALGLHRHHDLSSQLTASPWLCQVLTDAAYWSTAPSVGASHAELGAAASPLGASEAPAALKSQREVIKLTGGLQPANLRHNPTQSSLEGLLPCAWIGTLVSEKCS